MGIEIFLQLKLRIPSHQMMQKIKNLIFMITITVCILSMQLVSQAENINVFANDPRMISMKDTIYVHVNDMEHWEPELVDAIMNATRSCTGYEIQELYLHRNSVSLSKSDAQMLQERTKYVQDWMAFHMPEIVRDGLSKEEAISAVIQYICEHYTYNHAIAYPTTKEQMSAKKNAADAWYMLTEGSGVCTAFSCMFRAMIETIPFHDGVVGWNVQNADYIKVAIIENDAHMWNAIQDENGRWLIYDLSGAVENPNSTAAFCGILGGSLYGQADTQKWHY